MLGLRFSTRAGIASLALAGLVLSAPAAFATHSHHNHHSRIHGHVSGAYDDSYSLYEDYESVFPNTVDRSTECIGGYRWQRHNHDWYKTSGQDELPLPCY